MGQYAAQPLKSYWCGGSYIQNTVGLKGLINCFGTDLLADPVILLVKAKPHSICESVCGFVGPTLCTTVMVQSSVSLSVIQLSQGMD